MVWITNVDAQNHSFGQHVILSCYFGRCWVDPWDHR